MFAIKLKIRKLDPINDSLIHHLNIGCYHYKNCTQDDYGFFAVNVTLIFNIKLTVDRLLEYDVLKQHVVLIPFRLSFCNNTRT